MVSVFAQVDRYSALTHIAHRETERPFSSAWARAYNPSSDFHSRDRGPGSMHHRPAVGKKSGSISDNKATKFSGCGRGKGRNGGGGGGGKKTKHVF